MSFWKKKTRGKRIFLDYAGATPVDFDVKKVIEKYLDNFANPSALYKEALKVKDLIDSSRKKIAETLNCRKEEIIFTSGGTEGNNLALLGIFDKHKTPNFRPHFIVTEFEHPAILEVCKEIERRGGAVTKIPVSEEGIINPKDILKAITKETVLVSIMYANNEIGTIQPIREIGKIIREYRQKNNSSIPYFHTDGCQAGLYLSLDVSKLNVDLLTLDGLKIHGPRGCGILFIKDGVEISPINFGGGQERGFRSGTENTGGIIGISIALEKSKTMREEESERLTLLRDYGIDKILKEFPKATLNGSKSSRLPNNINICFPGLDAEFAVISLDVLSIACSYSSSCLSLKEDSSSYVVGSLGKKDCELSSLRFTMGRDTTESDIDNLILALKKIVK